MIPKMEKKPKRCQFPTRMIGMTTELILNASISFRAVPKVLHTIFSDFPSMKNEPIPTHKTVGRWLSKLGLYKLNLPKEQAADWAFIVDNSVQVGTSKCLVILGVRLSKLKGKPLEFADMETLLIEVHQNPDKNTVCQALEKAQNRVGKAVMLCADDGTDLRGGIHLFCKKHGVRRVFDTIHKIGTFLKGILGKDPTWHAFTKAAAEAKKKMQQTEAAHLMPPNQRSKSRFLNTEILTRWAVNTLAIMEEANHPDKNMLKKHCGWIVKYKNLIELPKQLDLINKRVRQHVRERGISSNTAKQVEELLEEIMAWPSFNESACQYAGKLIDFFKEQSQIVPENEIWICSSEVIESLFGKFKRLEQDQCKGGFTSLVLGIAACTGEVDARIVEEAMVRVKTKDVEAWVKREIGSTFLSKRKKAFRAKRRGKAKKNVQECAGTVLEKAVGF